MVKHLIHSFGVRKSILMCHTRSHHKKRNVMSNYQDQTEDVAAMDELNLDDLFLGEEDDHDIHGHMKGGIGGDGGGGGSLGGLMGDIFTDMEFDLGDIVGGIIGEDGGGGVGGGNRQSKVSFSNYLGGASSNDFDDGGHGGSVNDMLMGKMDFYDSDDADLMFEPQPLAVHSRRRSSLNIDSMVSSISPPVVARRGARTSRMNPHLAVLQQQQEQQQNIKQELSSLIAGGGGGERGSGGKRRRRKSKKFGIDYDDDSNEEEETGGVGEDAVAGDSGPIITKKSRRASSASPRLLNRPNQQGEVGANNQSLHTPSSAAAAAIRRHEQQQLQQQREENELQQQQRMVEIKQSFYEYGLPPSRLTFFPYMNLPNGLDVKRKGHQSYPILERFSNPQSSFGNDTGLAVAAIDAPTRRNSTGNDNSVSDLNFTTSETNVALITKTSPIYELFGQHIGVVDTNTTWAMESDKSNDSVESGGTGEQQQNQLPPSSNLIASLTKSTDQIHRILQQLQRHGKKKKKTLDTSKKKKKDSQECEQQGNQEQKQKQLGSILHHSSSASSPQQIIEDLANLYSSQVRQAAFLRQNLMNMESWCEDHLKKEDMGTAFPSRRRVEKVLQLLWAHKVNSYSNRISIIQQNQEMERLGGGKRADAFNTDIVNTTNPTILIKVKVKMSGWRDKPSKLIARLVCPRRWKVASKRGAENNAAATDGVPPPPLLTAIPTLDLSFADRATLETAACEVLRFDLIPKKKTTLMSTCGANSSPTTSTSLVNVNEVTMMETLTDSPSPISKSSPVFPDSTKTVVSVKRGLNSVVSDKKEVVKKKTKKMRSKLNEESVSAAIVSSSLSTTDSITPSHPPSSASIMNTFVNKKKVVPMPLVSMPHVSMPHIPGYHQIPKEGDDNDDVYRQERHRLVRELYGSILQPAKSPTERRSILANEISLTMARLKKHHERKQKQIHASNNSNRYRMETIDREILDLQATYLDDLAIMPETCSTFGLWNYMTKSNYFDLLEKEEDVFIGLEGIFQPEVIAKEDELLNEIEVDEYCWGRLPNTLPARILAKTTAAYFSEEEGDGENSAKEKVTENGEYKATSSSPIYERLQSLLVEEDDWSKSSDILDRDGGVSDEDDDDDDDDNLLASLPSYSPEDFIHGPKRYADIELKEDNSSSTNDSSFTKDKSTLDLSALTLDQRTYIQLCAADLVDRKLMPFSGVVSSSSSSSDEPPPSFATKTLFDDDDDDDDAEPVDLILQKMMDKLSSLNVEMNARVSKLQRMALSHVNAVEAAATTPISTQPYLSSSPCQRNKEEENDDETLILLKYKRLEKHQRKEKQRQDIRTSGRVKMGSNKFDDEEWLPW